MSTPPDRPAPLRLGFVTGTTPDKWAARWRERRERIELVPVTEEQQLAGISDGTLDMCLVRLAADEETPAGTHRVRLYDEVPVAVMSTDHAATVVDELSTADLAEEQLVRPHWTGWRPSAAQLDWPPMTEREAVETVAAGTGVVILPMSVARLLGRKDVTHRPVTDLPPTTVWLVWQVDRDDDRTQAFVGVVRGRGSRSSRG